MFLVLLDFMAILCLGIDEMTLVSKSLLIPHELSALTDRVHLCRAMLFRNQIQSSKNFTGLQSFRFLIMPPLYKW